jgi:hypothetical protein
MARRVFFSFHYSEDCWRANQVRNANVVHGADVAGFFDHSEYDDARAGGDAAIRRMILRHLEGTSVTVVLIGTYTAGRPWVRFEIAESIKRNNGLLGIRVNHLFNQYRHTAPPGPIPVTWPTEMPVFWWDPAAVHHFARLIAEAAERGDEARRRRVAVQKRALLGLRSLAPSTSVATGHTLEDILAKRFYDQTFKIKKP